jgi:solute carrier family 25 folate transporter 32
MNFIIGSSSAALAYTLVYPIDVIKVRYQNINYTNSCLKDVKLSNIVRQVYNIHGIKGFYKGCVSNIMSYPVFWGIYFETKSRLYSNPMLNTYLASTLASAFTNPLFVMRTKLQNCNKNMSYPKMIKNLYRERGLLGFYKGYPMTMIDNFKLCGLMTLNSYFINIVRNENDTILQQSAKITYVSSISKLGVSLILYPTDIIRTIQRSNDTKISMLKIIKRIYHKDGIKGFYKGGVLNMCTKIPSFSLTMLFKSWMESFLKK